MIRIHRFHWFAVVTLLIASITVIVALFTCIYLFFCLFLLQNNWRKTRRESCGLSLLLTLSHTLGLFMLDHQVNQATSYQSIDPDFLVIGLLLIGHLFGV